MAMSPSGQVSVVLHHLVTRGAASPRVAFREQHLVAGKPSPTGAAEQHGAICVRQHVKQGSLHLSCLAAKKCRLYGHVYRSRYMGTVSKSFAVVIRPT